MPASVTEQRVTKEQFENLPDAFRCYEVVDGQLVEVEPMGNRESALAVYLGHLLIQHVGAANRHGVLGPDSRFRLKADPDLIRGCDVAYVPKDRMPGSRPGPGVGDYVPAFAVEIVSPSNTAEQVQRKIDEWFDAGTDLVWIIYPENRSVHVYRSRDEIKILRQGTTLDGGSVLPGLSIPVADLFD